MSTLVAKGWPVEYAGPRGVLGNQRILWAGYPRIYEREDGEWVWECTPAFLNYHAFTDFIKLHDAGWHVRVQLRKQTLQVRITEKEGT